MMLNNLQRLNRTTIHDEILNKYKNTFNISVIKMTSKIN